MSLHTHFFIELFFQFYQTILAFGHRGGIGIFAQLLPFFKNNPKTMKINVRIILITGQTILMIFIIFHAISWPKRQKHSHLSVIIFVFKTLTGRTSWHFIKKRGYKDNCIVITVLPDRKRVLEFGSSSRNPSTPACILTDAIPSCFRTITNSSLTIIFFLKKSYE